MPLYSTDSAYSLPQLHSMSDFIYHINIIKREFRNIPSSLFRILNLGSTVSSRFFLKFSYHVFIANYESEHGMIKILYWNGPRKFDESLLPMFGRKYEYCIALQKTNIWDEKFEAGVSGDVRPSKIFWGFFRF